MSFSKKTYSYLYPVFALLLCGVLTFNLFSGNLHEIKEHITAHVQNNCSEENEKDACHRFTVHHQKSEACNGAHQHISVKQKECFSCKYAKDRLEKIVPSQLVSSVSFIGTLCFSSSSQAEFLSYTGYIFLRGPPSFIS